MAGPYWERQGLGGSKRLLAVDGGGIRGVMALRFLGELECRLRARVGGDDSWRLADFFDYIGGTSTGAIIAAGLSMGKSVGDIEDLYRRLGRRVFRRSYARLAWHLYPSERLAGLLKREFGEDTTFGSPELRTLLMVVVKNRSTDSPWPLSNNTWARYNQTRQGAGSNLDLPLWQLVRASTAAPIFFPAERIRIRGAAGERIHKFVDGGITPFNNPAFQLFLMATLDGYQLGWKTGVDELLLVSVGTGTEPKRLPGGPLRDHLVRNLVALPSELMNAASINQDVLCRVFGQCLSGPDFGDDELGPMLSETGAIEDKLFTYLRYDMLFDSITFADAGLGDIDPGEAARLDGIGQIDNLQRIGATVAKSIDLDHYRAFLPTTGRQAPTQP